MWGWFAGGLYVCVSVPKDRGSVGGRGGCGSPRPARGAVRGANPGRGQEGTCAQPQGDRRSLAPAVEQTGASERKSPSLPWRRLASPAAGLPGELGKVLPAAGLAHGTPRHSHQESYPKLSAATARCSAHLHLHSRLGRARGPYRASTARPVCPRAPARPTGPAARLIAFQDSGNVRPKARVR